MLEKFKRSNIKFDDKIKSEFFGDYASEIENFTFSPDERNLIGKIVERLHAPTVIKLTPAQEHDILQKWKKNCGWFCDETPKYNNIPKPDLNAPEGSKILLQKLLDTAKRNEHRPKNGFRYDNDIKRMAVYNRMLSGPLGFNTLQGNLIGSLPSLGTTNRYIHRTDHIITEGILRLDELKVYLNNRQQPMWVSLSEDATRIINRIQYDSQTNQLLGFVLPTDQNTGIPIPFIYKARNAEEMCSHFCNNPKIAKFVNTVIAQPLGGAPPFCLLIYGTDNRYTTDNVAKRWNFISDQLRKLGVNVLTISSDSDPKLNGAMRMNSCLGLDSNEYSVDGLFKCGTNKNPPYYVQDPPHMLTKLRNLLLNY